jgi:hypothetical protein
MLNAAGRNVTVQAAQGAGENWLALNNGVNSGTSSYYDSLGIGRDVPTIDGATYTFTLDYAGALGLSAANTRIGVYVDGWCSRGHAISPAASSCRSVPPVPMPTTAARQRRRAT